MPTVAVNGKFSEYDIYVGRPSAFGNPFHIGKDGTRDEVIEKFRKYLLNNQDLLNKLPELFGKVISCHCLPQKCHATVIADLANEYEARIKEFAI